MERNNRFKSPVVWLSFITELVVILGLWGVYEKIGVDQKVVAATLTFIIVSLGSFGILNNPKDKSNF